MVEIVPKHTINPIKKHNTTASSNFPLSHTPDDSENGRVLKS